MGLFSPRSPTCLLRRACTLSSASTHPEPQHHVANTHHPDQVSSDWAGRWLEWVWPCHPGTPVPCRSPVLKHVQHKVHRVKHGKTSRYITEADTYAGVWAGRSAWLRYCTSPVNGEIVPWDFCWSCLHRRSVVEAEPIAPNDPARPN